MTHKRIRKELLLYTTVSAIAWLLDVAVLYVAVLWLDLPEFLAAALGYSVGLVVHYALSVRYVFDYRRLEGQSGIELMVYALSGVTGIALSAGVVHLGSLAGLTLFVSKLVATAIAFLAVFAIRKVTLFSMARNDSEGDP
jgi:putative flippase GtrA